jgi:hypothetical protein
MVVLPAAIAASMVLYRPALAASVADWRADIDTVVRDVETIHPNAFTKTPRGKFEAAARDLKAALPRLTEEQRMARAMQLVALIGDGHTQLDPHRPDFADWYPVRFYQFTDGYFITAAYKTDADLAGAKVLAIAGRPVGEVADAARTLEGSDNALNVTEHIFALENAELMRALGYAGQDGSLPITVQLSDGRRAERNLKPHRADDPRYPKNDSTFDWRFSSEVYGPPIGTLDDWTTAYKGLSAAAYRKIDNSRPIHFTFRRPYVARAIPEQSAYYIGVNNIADWTASGKGFHAFFRDALAEIDTMKPRSVIIDLRYNPGGDGYLVPAVMHEFVKREDNPPWKHLYLLTGRKTFSAAVIFMAGFIYNVPCTIVGEPAGAPLDSYGDATDIDLDRTGMRLHVSTIWHKLEDQGERYTIMPVDVPAPFSFADYAAGRDPAIDAILNGQEMRSLPLIAVEDGGAAARKVFEERRSRYSAYADWMRVREYDLRRAYFTLDDAKRYADAVEVAKLMTDLYPDSANAWARRGDAEISLGDKAAGLTSYRRALQLDPNNLANVDQRAAIAAAENPAK